jgi:hypothetical protein
VIDKLALSAAFALMLSACGSLGQAPPPSAEVASTSSYAVPYRGTDKFAGGPLYNGPDYLGDDPDPFIRAQIRRDLGIRYPGMN